MPTAKEAAELIARYGNGLFVADAVAYLRKFGEDLTAQQAAELLPKWGEYRWLKAVEVQVVLAHFVAKPEPSDADDIHS